MESEGIRLNKFLSEAGVCSRREADRLIDNGKVRINGQAVTAGQKVLPGQSVSVNGRVINASEKKRRP